MKKIKKMLPYLIIIMLSFYVLPLAIKDTGSAMFVLLVVTPLICFACSVFYGVKNSFNLLYCLIVAGLFVPCIFIFYNFSAWVYIFGYGAAALAGNFIGKIFYKGANTLK